ncbi:hypothetical protein [Fodinicola acaciae]|uniref:hypothetical protein n=1 Tax=Fodinicola acaciae TaxID=2681555 RepID=UPI0013D3DF93|nr:hypothetical protein [Fodinicola acaciae]
MTDMPVDVELLAEYAEGLLEGTPEAELVAGRLAADPAWRQAYEQLPAATAAVSAQLAMLEPEPLPDDVLSRIESALAEPEPPVSSLSAARERRRGRLRLVLAAAAAVAILFVGGGVVFQQLRPEPLTSADGATGEGRAAPNAAAAPGHVRITSSGRDWTVTTLPMLRQPGGAKEAQADTAGKPAQLRRFDDKGILEACLQALRALGGEPTYVDLARFGGSPAVLAVLSTSAGDRVVAVSPGCGDGPTAVTLYGPVAAS